MCRKSKGLDLIPERRHEYYVWYRKHETFVRRKARIHWISKNVLIFLFKVWQNNPLFYNQTEIPRTVALRTYKSKNCSNIKINVQNESYSTRQNEEILRYSCEIHTFWFFVLTNPNVTVIIRVTADSHFLKNITSLHYQNSISFSGEQNLTRLPFLKQCQHFWFCA